MIDDIDRAKLEQTQEELLDGLQFAQHRMKAFQLEAAMGGDEQPMVDEMAKIARIEAKLTGLGYGLVKVEQNERAALSASRIAERKAEAEELRSFMKQHATALAELGDAVTSLLPIGEQIRMLAADIERLSTNLFPADDAGWMTTIAPLDSFLRAAGVLQGPNIKENLQALSDFAGRVAGQRDSALQKLSVVIEGD